MATIQIAVEIDGESSTSEIDVTFDASRFTLREMVRVEDALGAEWAEKFLAGELAFTPKALQAILWAKIASQYPEVGLEDFDLPAEVFGEIGRSSAS